MIRFVCGSCHQKLSVPKQHAGRRGKCPKCGSITHVPSSQDVDIPSPLDAPAAAAPVSVGPIADSKPIESFVVKPTPAPPKAPGLVQRLTTRVGRKPADDIHSADAVGIPRAIKLLFVIGVLVVMPLVVAAGFLMLILARLKLGN